MLGFRQVCKNGILGIAPGPGLRMVKLWASLPTCPIEWTPSPLSETPGSQWQVSATMPTCLHIGPCPGSLGCWAWQPPRFELDWWPGQTQVVGNVASGDSALLAICWAMQAGYVSTWTRVSSLWAGAQAALLPTSLAPVVTCYAALWSCDSRAWWCPRPLQPGRSGAGGPQGRGAGGPCWWHLP